jgi:hypothetical protein
MWARLRLWAAGWASLEELEDGFGGLANFVDEVGRTKEGSQLKNCQDDQ